jgi:hypothetical protein
MLDQIGLKIQNHQSRSQICFPLKNAYESSRCLVVDRWSNDENNGVIFLIVAVISLIIKVVVS